ncbi:MAG TPA: prepilin-type N-terminal cleavage/methylation domain-containing protein, partial [Roseimicrobium sp.]|nr:prepilin-type N-terminal cleavage/methylation domain-containing protein [Roseimicrobium sp.]
MVVSGLNKTHRFKGRRIAAFTLVELLVVIGIIGLLISILLPSLSKAQEQAKRIKCAAQVRQHCAALIMYANDNKGRLPDYGNKKGDFNRSGVTVTKDELQLVHPELRDMLKDVYGVPRQMFFCPTSPENDSLGMTSQLVW